VQEAQRIPHWGYLKKGARRTTTGHDPDSKSQPDVMEALKNKKIRSVVIQASENCGKRVGHDTEELTLSNDALA